MSAQDADLLARYDLAFDAGRMAAWEWDLTQGVITRSRHAVRLLAGSCENPQESTVDDAVALVHPADREVFSRHLQGCREGGEGFDLEYRLVWPDGQVRWFHDHALVHRSQDGTPARVHGVMADITQRKREAASDRLTGLPNRTLVTERLEEALSAGSQDSGNVAVLMLDLDRFNAVNESYGHATGDALLRIVGERLCHTVGARQLVGRFGGDEFVVLAEGTLGVEEGIVLARRILDSIGGSMLTNNGEFHLSASVGIAFADGDAGDAHELLRDADAAMHQAKEQGGGGLVVFDDEWRVRARARMDLEADLRRALSDREIMVHYQPEVDLLSGRIVGFEALARWEHAERGFVPPDQFIPVAEEMGLIVPLGREILEIALQQLAAWEREGAEDLWIAVNLSARQLLSPDLVSDVKHLLDASGLNPGQLCLEVTETMLVADAVVAQDVLGRMRDLGVKVAIDDFGTGYSSLTHVKNFPVDFIKIDREFVDGLDVYSGDTAIVTAVLGMANALDIPVIAEGVESPAQRMGLVQRGCTFAQGYLFAKPQPAVAFDDIVRSSVVSVTG